MIIQKKKDHILKINYFFSSTHDYIHRYCCYNFCSFFLVFVFWFFFCLKTYAENKILKPKYICNLPHTMYVCTCIIYVQIDRHLVLKVHQCVCNKNYMHATLANMFKSRETCFNFKFICTLIIRLRLQVVCVVVCVCVQIQHILSCALLMLTNTQFMAFGIGRNSERYRARETERENK